MPAQKLYVRNPVSLQKPRVRLLLHLFSRLQIQLQLAEMHQR